MHCLWSFSEVVLILKLATDQLAFSVSGKICFMSGFNQTGCSKLEIFLTEVTFICVLISDDLPYHGIYYSFSKIFINFHYIYIYIGSSNVSFGFLLFSRQLPSKTGVHIPSSFRVSVHQRTKPYKVEATLSVICSLSQQSTRAFIGLRRLPDLIGTSPSLVIFLRTCLDCQVKLCTGLDLVF